MADIVEKETRSKMMSRIRGKDTNPEMVIRRGLHRRGLRFRVHDRRLPGRPDLYFPKYRAVIFVNGCFWHRHHCDYFRWPATRPEFWKSKLEGNVSRDAARLQSLQDSGIRTLVIWECAIRGKDKDSIEGLIRQAEKWLKNGCDSSEIPSEPVSLQ